MEAETVVKILEEAADGQEIILESGDFDGDEEVEEIIEIVEEIEEIDENEQEHIQEEEEVHQEEQVPAATIQTLSPQKTNGALNDIDKSNKKVNINYNISNTFIINHNFLMKIIS